MTGRTLESAVVKLHEKIINPCKIKQPATFIAGARGVLSIMACGTFIRIRVKEWVAKSDEFRFLGNCPPTPPLS